MCYQPTTCNLLCISTWSGRFDETVSAFWEECSNSKSCHVFSFPTVFRLFHYLFVSHLCFALLSVRAFGDRTLRQQYRSSLKAEMRGMSLDMFELLNFQLCYVLVILVQSDAFHIVQMHSDAFSIIQRCHHFSYWCSQCYTGMLKDVKRIDCIWKIVRFQALTEELAARREQLAPRKKHLGETVTETNRNPCANV